MGSPACGIWAPLDIESWGRIHRRARTVGEGHHFTLLILQGMVVQACWGRGNQSHSERHTVVGANPPDIGDAQSTDSTRRRAFHFP